MKRSHWRVARITKLIHSKDNEIRSAEILTKDKRTVLRRSIKKLYPFVQDQNPVYT